MKKKHLHILGICGTAMAAIACLAGKRGYHVTGSDSGIYPPMSDYLEAMGIAVTEFDAENLVPRPDLVVVGNAVSRGNVEVETVLDDGIPYTSGAQFLHDHILPGRHSVVVAGTHGKTTTASLMAHVLDTAGLSPGFLIGGVPENFGGGARLGEGEPFVLEGDEYDTAFFDKRSKFIHYQPRTLILNNLEYDHADIFPDLEAIKTQFHHLVRTVPASGHLIFNADDTNIVDVLARGSWTPLFGFAERGGETEAGWQWESLSGDGSRFRLWCDDAVFIEAEWSMIGRHHVANACAVAVAATMLGVSAATISKGFETFAGIRRRMTLMGEVDGVRVYDDFAHHPTAIEGVVSAMGSRLGPGERLWVVVEPRSNTMRMNIHQVRLPDCFEAANFVLFVPPSQRNLRPEQALDVERVCREIGEHASVLPDAEAIIQYLTEHAKSGDYVLILSNGGFEDIHKRLLKALSGRE
ncbi:MAG TPA: UDP-N-acetylmuramate:L-alanyl-gamma-D-glutamyl-meso-diaminopimelate ligase [Mariprofundaceae bacterium]|nr:UDP-N-acetylmuramate:L-alanyl-gamma-D-glutamyl-meso-diaminopimelate ligase [Mariprofundaceae bacterium]